MPVLEAPPNVRARQARLLGQLILIALAASAALYSRTALSPLQETVRNALALNDNQIALLQGPALALPMVLTAAPIGYLIDHQSRARLMFTFAVLIVVGSALTALAPDFAILFTARCIIGVSAPAIATAAASMVADAVSADHRGRANMFLSMGQVAGMSAAFAFGGATLSRFGARPQDWHSAMAILTLPLVPVAALLLALREPLRTEVESARRGVRTYLGGLWAYRRPIVPLFVGFIMVSIADGASMIWVAPVLARRFALEPARIGGVLALVLMISGLLGPLVGGVVADYSQRTGGPRRAAMSLGGLILIGAPVGLFALAQTAPVMIGLLTVFLLLGAACNVAVTTLLTVVIPNELRGLCMSIVWTTGALFGLGIAPLSISLLSGQLGGASHIGVSLAVVCACSSVVGGIAVALSGRSFPARGGASDRIFIEQQVGRLG